MLNSTLNGSSVSYIMLLVHFPGDFFILFNILESQEYERKMVFLQGLGNLLLGNVADYLDPIIRDETLDTDTRFLAILATLPMVRTRADKVYETFWPLFQNHNTSLELRVISFYTLVLSNPSPARLMSLHNVLRKETNPHLINFYHTTILSMSGTTHPCYQDLYGRFPTKHIFVDNFLCFYIIV